MGVHVLQIQRFSTPQRLYNELRVHLAAAAILSLSDWNKDANSNTWARVWDEGPVPEGKIL